ncbi:MAG: GNAT family N-acetyltransferase [Terriglobia bacterium]
MARPRSSNEPPTNVRIRIARDTDFVQCIEITHQAWPEFPERNSIYHLFTKHFSSTSLIAEAAEGLVGFLLAFRSPAHPELGYVHLVATRPAWQGRGIAGALYERIFSIFRDSGCSTVRCIIDPGNKRSLNFHQAIGFRPSPTGPTIDVGGVLATRDYNGASIHMVEMERPLESEI